MIDKTAKTNKKKNVNSEMIDNNITQEIEKVMDKNIEQPLKKIVKDNYKENTKKMQTALKKIKETPKEVEEISDCFANIQQGLFAANMAFYTKSLTCYSVNEAINLSQDYFNNILNCCFSEGAKISNKLLFNNDLMNRILSSRS